MFHRLGQCSAENDPKVLRVCCDKSGLYFGPECKLITRYDIGKIAHYRVESLEFNGRKLSVGYGTPFDLKPFERTLHLIAEHLSKGALGRAQMMALHMKLPDLPDAKAIERLRKAGRLLRFNPNHDAQGRFASAPGGGARADQKRPKFSPSRGGQAARTAAAELNRVASAPNTKGKFSVSGGVPGLPGAARLDVAFTRNGGSQIHVSIDATALGGAIRLYSFSGDGVLEAHRGNSVDMVVSNIKWNLNNSQIKSAPSSIRLLETVSGALSFEIPSSIEGRGREIMPKGQYDIK